MQFNYNLQQPKYLDVGIINCTLAEVETEFVPAYNPVKPTRRAKIWLQYQNYLYDLRQVIGVETPFFQWLDGSFISKKHNPNDFDVVTFLSEEVFMRCGQQLFHFTQPAVSMNYGKYLDAYIVTNTSNSLSYWEMLFNKVKNEKPNPPLPLPFKKGFIQINF